MDVVEAKRLAEKIKKLYGRRILLKDNFNGITPPSNLVTVKKYPILNLGVLASEETVNLNIEDPSYLATKNYSFEDIIKHKSLLINFYTPVSAYDVKDNKFYEKVLEISQSIKSLDIEVKIKKIFEERFHTKIFSFFGFKGKIEQLSINDNPKIPNILYEISEISAKEGVVKLYESNFSDYYISRLFSLGFFGYSINRKLVPSKWSITAVQRIIEEKINREIKDFKIISSYFLSQNRIYGNDLYGIIFPGNGEVEMLEVLMPGSAYNREGNYPIIGKDSESGGYYAVRLSFKEFLRMNKFRANLLLIRVVTNEYKFPLGSWVLREGTKIMFKKKIEIYSSMNEILNHLNNIFWNKYNMTIFKIIKNSEIINRKSILRFF